MDASFIEEYVIEGGEWGVGGLGAGADGLQVQVCRWIARMQDTGRIAMQTADRTGRIPNELRFDDAKAVDWEKDIARVT